MTENNIVSLPAQQQETAAPLATLPVMGTFDLTPRTLSEALTLSEHLSKSTMVPKDYIDKPGNILVAIQWGLEIGLKPLQAVQNIAVIGQRPGLYGDAGKALLLSKGCTIIEDDIRVIEGKSYASCTIKRPGKPDVTRTFGIDDARRAGLWGKQGPWTTSPYRQMAWRAFWFAARDQCADYLRGIDGAEALRDLQQQQEIDITPPKETAAEQTKQPAEKRSDKVLAERQEKRVKECCDAFDTARNDAELGLAVEKAQGLPDTVRARVGEHYKKAKARIAELAKPPAETTDTATGEITKNPEQETQGPLYTFAQLVDKMNEAKSKDELDLLADHIKALPADQQPALLEQYKGKAAAFEGK